MILNRLTQQHTDLWITDLWIKGSKQYKARARSLKVHAAYSVVADADEFVDAVGRHWRIANNLHWNLDIIPREDGCRARKDNSLFTPNLIRKSVLELLGKLKIMGLRERCIVSKDA